MVKSCSEKQKRPADAHLKEPIAYLYSPPDIMPWPMQHLESDNSGDDFGGCHPENFPEATKIKTS